MIEKRNACRFLREKAERKGTLGRRIGEDDILMSLKGIGFVYVLCINLF
jgi:hypothetical protein